MEVIIWPVLIVLGFVFGYFLQTTILVMLTVIFIIAGTLMMANAREIEHLIAMLFVACFITASAIMWVTWYFVNKQTFMQDFFTHYIFR
ncbi:MAG: hypothetical protein HGA36_00405 [Candidatus Moranbacteria bacterium]|nr:hypothetical protein [Candidatus Moranbacteria bacterium]